MWKIMMIREKDGYFKAIKIEIHLKIIILFYVFDKVYGKQKFMERHII